MTYLFPHILLSNSHQTNHLCFWTLSKVFTFVRRWYSRPMARARSKVLLRWSVSLAYRIWNGKGSQKTSTFLFLIQISCLLFQKGWIIPFSYDCDCNNINYSHDLLNCLFLWCIVNHATYGPSDQWTHPMSAHCCSTGISFRHLWLANIC